MEKDLLINSELNDQLDFRLRLMAVKNDNFPTLVYDGGDALSRLLQRMTDRFLRLLRVNKAALWPPSPSSSENRHVCSGCENVVWLEDT